MRPELTRLTRAFWRIATGLPGWADVPPRERAIRMLPLVVPLAGIVLLTGWDRLWQRPQRQAERSARAAAVQLEREVAELSLAFSDQQANDLAQQAAKLGAEVAASPEESAASLADLEQAAAAHGWSAQFERVVTVPRTEPPRGLPPMLGHTTLRGRLVPHPDNREQLKSLLALLEHNSARRPRIDLIQIAISADQGGWQGVELQLRSSHRLVHVQSPQ